MSQMKKKTKTIKYNDLSDSSVISKLLIITVFQVTKWIHIVSGHCLA